MKKRLKTGILHLIMMLPAVIAVPVTASANGTKIGALYYDLDDTNLTAAVTYEDNENFGYTDLPEDVTIPEKITYSGKTYTVTAIGSYAFYQNDDFYSIDIPNSVTTISDNAFYGCSGLSTLTIPSSVLQIGNKAFFQCDGLETVICYAPKPPKCTYDIFTDPNGLTLFVPFSALDAYRSTSPWSSIGTIKPTEENTKIGQLYYKLDNINRTAEVTYKNQESPSYTDLPTSLKIPETITYLSSQYQVTSIGDQAFARCTGLTSVTIPLTVTSIGNYAFSGCTGLTSVDIPHNFIKSIGEYAFSGCTGLTSADILNGLTSISPGTFNGCSGLTSVHLPNTVTSIGQYAFTNCTGLTSIEIPDLVTSIGYNVFAGCSGLTSINIPSSVTLISGSAFSDCTGLTSIDLPNSVTAIGGRAFQHTGLTSIDIPNSLISLGEQAFADCPQLTSVTIPSSLSQLPAQAFYNCQKLTTVTCNATTPPTCGSSVFTNPENATLIVQESAINTYKSTSPWSSFGTFKAIKIGDLCYNFDDTRLTAEVTYENSQSPRYTSLPAHLTIPETVTYYGHTYNVTSIGARAFESCTGLSSIDIPKAVTSISDLAFSNCSGLKSIEIPDAVTSIGSYAFRGCTGLTSFDIPGAVTSIGSSAFEDCSGLKSINIPNSVTSIGDYAFYGCTGLTSIEIPNSVTSIGTSTFSGCRGLTSIDIPNSVTSIANDAFYYCTGLASVTLPSSLSQVGQDAFKYCSKLATVTCYATTPPACGGDILTNPEKTALFVPAAALNAYQTTSPWSNFGTIKAIGDIPTGVTDLNVDRGITVTSAGGTVTIKGLDPTEEITYYDLNGVKLGETTASDGVTAFDAIPGSIVIVRTSNSAIKIAVK